MESFSFCAVKSEYRSFLIRVFPYKDNFVDSALIGKIWVWEIPYSGTLYTVCFLSCKKLLDNFCSDF